MRCTERRFSDSYAQIHRFDGAVIQRGRRDKLVPCAVQPRDVAIVSDVRRYKLLTSPQLRELWWAESSVQAADRRLLKLFRAGYLDRFRPISRRGSFPWTYQLGVEGHRLLQRAGMVGPRQRFLRREVYDYGHVLHELQLNAWVLAFRRAVGTVRPSWEGETQIDPPIEARARDGRLHLHNDWSAEGLCDRRARPLRPDAVLELARDDSEGSRLYFIEYDRTRRVDKNCEKFRRYDTFLCWWWRHTPLADRGDPPYVIFVCQDGNQRVRFIEAADHELTGHHWHPSVPSERHEYVGRQHILFADERDAHEGRLEAWRLPAFPPGRPAREVQVRRVPIGPGNSHGESHITSRRPLSPTERAA